MTSQRQSGQTKQERVYTAIRERILSGAYGPGYRVVIDALAEEFSVSALPVREAIRRLEAEGLVVYRPNAGAQVAPADPGLFDEEMSVLALLEGYATALAIPSLGSAEIDRLKQINDDMAEAMGRLDSLSFGRLNQEFHALIHERCPNTALVGLLRDVARRLDAIRRTVFVQIPYRGAASVAEHRQLIELLERRAPDAEVEALAREHKLNTVQSFRRWQSEQLTPPASRAGVRGREHDGRPPGSAAG
ncbi:MAG TPA: GntR family transcriptional regulator [Acidimicrobiales bacterium]|nr:GntR family transcriptional regulator [Acidimicrobiales bacterium]